MHLKGVTILSDRYPTRDVYPFNLKMLHETPTIQFESPVTFFIGENGSGKSTLLEALCHRCGIHIWREEAGGRVNYNPYEKELYRYVLVEWANGHVPGSYFSAEVFRDFARYLDDWAVQNSRLLDYFGGRSLMSQSHGQSLMSFFRSRYKIKGLYLMDEPETALSPRSQIALVRLLHEMGAAGHAQFIIATHSPILLACPGAVIYRFDHTPICRVSYKETEYYRIFKEFLTEPADFFKDLEHVVE